MEDGALGIKTGDLIQDTYKIGELLGEGGMGATFKGVNTATNHDVAIKVMIPSFARNKQAVELFRRESSLLRTVQNSAVVRYETTLQDKSGRLYLVMEHIEGKPLKHHLAQGARLKASDVLKLGSRLASGLHAIHELGIVHRDVAPDNILVPDKDILGAKFIDFGLASDTFGTDKSIIGDNVAMKFDFGAPEQFGLYDGKIGAHTDIYSLGLVLLKTATGNLVPGEGKGLAAMEARRQDIDLSGVKIDPVLRKVLSQMLRVDPSQRPSDLRKLFQSALATLDKPPSRKGEKASDSSGKKVSGSQPQGKSKPLIIVAGLAVVALLGLGAFLFLMDNGNQDFTGTGSTKQATEAKNAAQSDDPMVEITTMIKSGGIDNLNSAFGALVTIARDNSQSTKVRVNAFVMAAEMYDPKTYTTRNSPFSKPNANAAIRLYQKAADLGSQEARTAIARLGE